MKRRKGYIYTNKHHSQTGVMSTILGVISLVTLGISVYFSYLNKGVITERYGTSAFLALVFMVIGLGLGLFSLREPEKFRLFSVLGIVANVLVFAVLSLILFAGAYVD